MKSPKKNSNVKLTLCEKKNNKHRTLLLHQTFLAKPSIILAFSGLYVLCQWAIASAWLVQPLAAVLGPDEWKVEGTSLTVTEACDLGKGVYHIKTLCFRRVHVLRPTLWTLLSDMVCLAVAMALACLSRTHKPLSSDTQRPRL